MCIAAAITVNYSASMASTTFSVTLLSTHFHYILATFLPLRHRKTVLVVSTQPFSTVTDGNEAYIDKMQTLLTRVELT